MNTLFDYDKVDKVKKNINTNNFTLKHIYIYSHIFL